MSYIDILKIRPGLYYFDFDSDGIESKDEYFAVNGVTAADETLRVGKRLNEISLQRNGGCYSVRDNKPYLAGIFPRVRIFATKEAYLNVAYDADSETVKMFRTELQQQLDQQVTKLERIVAKKQLPADHPYVNLLKALQEVKRHLPTLRLTMTQPHRAYSNLGKTAGAAAINDERLIVIDPYKVSALLKTRKLPATVESFIIVLLPIFFHEAIHLLHEEFYTDRWTHSVKVVRQNGSICQQKDTVKAGEKRLGDKGLKTSFSFKLDFAPLRKSKTYTYASIPLRFRKFPFYLRQHSCVPPETNAARWASEIHAHLSQARLRAFMDGITADDIIQLQAGGPKASVIEQRLRAMYSTSKVGFFGSLMLHYFGLGTNDKGKTRQDLEDYVKAYYPPLTSEPNCLPPSLPISQPKK